MRRTRLSILVQLMWGIGGAAIGATAALFYARGLSPDWVEATGTWVGGVATVLALLWAVQTFRADQAARENANHQAARERKEELRAIQQAVLAEAGRVSLELRGGGGYGNPPEQKMTSFHINIHNDSEHVATVDEIQLRPPLVPKTMPRLPIRVAAKSSWSQLLDIEPIDADASELSDRPVSRFSGSIFYRVEGRNWARDTGVGPRPN